MPGGHAPARQPGRRSHPDGLWMWPRRSQPLPSAQTWPIARPAAHDLPAPYGDGGQVGGQPPAKGSRGAAGGHGRAPRDIRADGTRWHDRPHAPGAGRGRRARGFPEPPEATACGFPLAGGGGRPRRLPGRWPRHARGATPERPDGLRVIRADQGWPMAASGSAGSEAMPGDRDLRPRGRPAERQPRQA